MKKMLLTLMGFALIATFSIAAEVHTEQQNKEDAARHRAIAGAHASASSCLAAKSDPASCLATLKRSCTGLGIGKYCGLKQDAWDNAAPVLTKTAQAHLVVAACMEAGKPYEGCLWDLQSACKGLAVGKYCGLLHAH
jgi:hypothetical protein